MLKVGVYLWQVGCRAQDRNQTIQPIHLTHPNQHSHQPTWTFITTCMAVFNILISKVRWQTWRWRRWMVYSPWLLKLPFGFPENFQPKSLNCTVVNKGNCPTQRFRILRRYVWLNRGHHFESNNSQLIQLEGGVTSTNPEGTITFRLRMPSFFSLYIQQVWFCPAEFLYRTNGKLPFPEFVVESVASQAFHCSWTKSQVILI